MGTVPVLPGWSVGEDITAADLQAMSDAITWDFATRPVFFATQAVAQSAWTSGAFTPITFTTEVIDRDGQHSTTLQTSRVVIGGTLGWYRVSGVYVPAGNTAATLVRSNLALNGVAINGSYAAHQPTTSGNTLGIPTPVVIVQATTATDYVEINGAVTAASGTLGTAVGGSGATSALLVEWIGS